MDPVRITGHRCGLWWPFFVMPVLWHVFIMQKSIYRIILVVLIFAKCLRSYVRGTNLKSGVLCQKQESRPGTNNYIPQIRWDVIPCPCSPVNLTHSYTQSGKNSHKRFLSWFHTFSTPVITHWKSPSIRPWKMSQIQYGRRTPYGIWG